MKIVSKLFTSILNDRITEWAEMYNLISELLAACACVFLVIVLVFNFEC